MGLLGIGLLVIAFWKASLPHDWRLTKSMLTPRREHQAICLNDGCVLVLGGYTAEIEPVLTCELFDPAHETWSPVGALRYGDGGYGVVLPDGRVLIAEEWMERPPNTPGTTVRQGGLAPSKTTWQIFNPKTSAWSSVPDSPTFPNSEQDQSVGELLLLKDGRVFVYNYSHQALFYNPSTNSWSGILNCPEGLIGFIVLADGRVLGMRRISMESNQLLDPSSGTWSPCARMRALTGWGTLLPDGTVFYLSESFASPEVRIYVPKSNTWSKYGSPRVVQPVKIALTQLESGNVLMVGGTYGTWDPWNLPVFTHPLSDYRWYWYYWRTATISEAVSECDLFNWKTKQWNRTGSLLQPRAFHATTLLKDGRVLVTGGVSSDGKLLNTCEIGSITEDQ